ncbi:MAG: M28 family peptidase [Phycisphaerales bacterium]
MDSAPKKKRRFRFVTRAALKRLAVFGVVCAIGLVHSYLAMLRMPGRSYSGALPELTQRQRELCEQLKRDEEHLASEGGQRSTFYPRRFAETALWLKHALERAGYEVNEHSFVKRGAACPNLEVTVPGTTRANEIIVVGAHYDSYQGAPGADDNASGVAAVLALARRGANTPHERTVRYVLFVNEEPPSFMTEDMGSLVYARACKENGDNIKAMISLESIGYYSDKASSQQYPPPLGMMYPDRGDFIAFVGNYSGRSLLKRSLRTFRESTEFPSEGAALPWFVPGVAWSDHWAFWKVGYEALMVTGTAPFRNPNYHTLADTPNTLDYQRMARVVEGVEHVVSELSNGE